MVAPTAPSADTRISWKGVNPKLKGSKAYERFEKYSKATTVGQFFELGGTSQDLANDRAKGFLQVSILKRPAEQSSVSAVEAPQKSPAPKSATSPSKGSGPKEVSASPKKGPVAAAKSSTAPAAPVVVLPAAAEVTRPKGGKAGKVLAAMKKPAAVLPLTSKAQAKGKVKGKVLPANLAAAEAAAAVAASAATEAAAAPAADAKAKAVKKAILKRPEGGKPAGEGPSSKKGGALSPAQEATPSNKAPFWLAKDACTFLTWVDFNPKAAASMAHARFEKYRGASTVEAFFKRGGMRNDLNYDLKKRFVKFGKATGKDGLAKKSWKK